MLRQHIVETNVQSINAEGVFTGYAAVFDKVDQGRDVIAKGAFNRSLKADTSRVKLLWQHDPKIPIGRVEVLREDERGLFIQGRLALDAAQGREAYALLKAQALDGLSIGYRVRQARADAGRGIRHLVEVDLWEVSLVTFPMQQAARIQGVKSTPATARAFEEFLRKSGGYSRRAAKAITAGGFHQAGSKRDALARETSLAGWHDVLRSVRAAQTTLNSVISTTGEQN